MGRRQAIAEARKGGRVDGAQPGPTLRDWLQGLGPWEGGPGIPAPQTGTLWRGGRPVPAPDLPLTGVRTDSREVGPGDLFVALPGSQHDGHDFVPDALARGARAVLVAREGRTLSARFPQAWVLEVNEALGALQRVAAWWRRRFTPRTVGITGSLGKTTTKAALAAILEEAGPTLASPRSFNNEVGLPLTLLALRPRHRYLVLEMGTYGPGEIRALCALARPEAGIVTAIAGVHLERMGDLETVARAKGELPEALPPDGLAVLNGDDPRVRALARRTRARVLLYGRAADADLQLVDVEDRGLEGQTLALRWQGGLLRIHTPLPGRPGRQAALAAAALALGWGLPPEAVRGGLARARSPRIRVLPGPRGSRILDDSYNAAPESVLAALELLARTPGRRLAALGEMLELGPREAEGHRQVGAAAARVAEALALVGPRTRWIAEGARDAGMDPARIYQAPDHAAAARWLLERLGPDVWLLVKGSRGSAMERVIEELKGLDEAMKERAEHAP